MAREVSGLGRLAERAFELGKNAREGVEGRRIVQLESEDRDVEGALDEGAGPEDILGRDGRRHVHVGDEVAGRGREFREVFRVERLGRFFYVVERKTAILGVRSERRVHLRGIDGDDRETALEEGEGSAAGSGAELEGRSAGRERKPEMF